MLSAGPSADPPRTAAGRLFRGPIGPLGDGLGADSRCRARADATSRARAGDGSIRPVNGRSARSADDVAPDRRIVDTMTDPYATPPPSFEPRPTSTPLVSTTPSATPAGSPTPVPGPSPIPGPTAPGPARFDGVRTGVASARWRVGRISRGDPLQSVIVVWLLFLAAARDLRADPAGHSLALLRHRNPDVTAGSARPADRLRRGRGGHRRDRLHDRDGGPDRPRGDAGVRAAAGTAGHALRWRHDSWPDVLTSARRR